MANKKCLHNLLESGPRIPAAYGTLSSIKCSLCGAWRCVGDRDWIFGPLTKEQLEEMYHQQERD